MKIVYGNIQINVMLKVSSKYKQFSKYSWQYNISFTCLAAP